MFCLIEKALTAPNPLTSVSLTFSLDLCRLGEVVVFVTLPPSRVFARFVFSLEPAAQTQCEVPEPSEQPVKVKRLRCVRAGPDSLGTGSVSGFGGWWLKLSP